MCSCAKKLIFPNWKQTNPSYSYLTERRLIWKGNRLIIHLDRATGACFWNFHFSIAKITYKFFCQQFSYEVPCHNIAEFATTRNGSDCNDDRNIYLNNLWRYGFWNLLFLSFWPSLCLIRAWLYSFNVWCVSIDKDYQWNRIAFFYN